VFLYPANTTAESEIQTEAGKRCVIAAKDDTLHILGFKRAVGIGVGAKLIEG